MAVKKRATKLSLKATQGAINYFFAFVDGERVIGQDGTKERSWEGTIPAAETRIKVRVTGIDDARYTFGFSVESMASDQKVTFNLRQGYHEFELRL